MRLEEIQLIDFKNFKDFTLRLNPSFNLIIGRNGTGKTAILDAITKSVSEYYRGLKAGDPKELKVEDVRIFKTLESVEQANEASISAKCQLDNQIIAWRITRPVAGRSRNSDTADQIRNVAKYLNAEVKNETRNYYVDLPLIAYYSTARLWITGRLDYHTPKKSAKEKEEGKLPSRFRGYKNSLQIGTNFKEFLEWYKGKEQAAIQKKGDSFQLECVRNVVVQNIPDCTNVYYELDPDIGQSLMIQLRNSPPLKYAYLSDGYRSMLAMFADIAWRCVTLNPHFGVNANLETEGIAMIDELDLHLHPAWQKNIIKQLKDTFPKLQFICTSHSPFIIQETADGELFRLEEDDGVAVAGGEEYSLEDTVEYLQLVPDPAWSGKKLNMYENAKRYFALLEELQNSNQEARINSIREELNVLGKPYSDNVAYIAFLEQKRMLAEAKKFL